jgi:Zn-dependent metalloprotease
MCYHKCFCHFIPPHILEKLARSGAAQTRAGAKIGMQQSKLSRVKRATKAIDMKVFTGAAAAGEGARQIWDSQHTWDQRLVQVCDESGPSTSDPAVENTFKFIGLTRKFWRELLDRNSYDNLGSDLIANVHFGTDYMNAFWDGDEITLGDGDGTTFVSFADSLDVMAHEMGHGVTQFTADLDYNGQSGALNEHFSDVFGSAVTQYYEGQDAGSADWLIGDEIMGPQLFGEALRSMKAPGTAYNHPLIGSDPQPDHMNNYYSGSADNQGVHINSGIPNKAFCLVSLAIGTDKAVRIWYHALQNLWPTAQFNDAVDIIVNSARIKVKEGQAPKGTTQTVRAAFKAVGLPA